jgi:hypothetical protein
MTTRKRSFFAAVLALFAGTSSGAPRTSLEYPTDAFAVRERLLQLAPGEMFEGVEISEGNGLRFMNGWHFRRAAKNAGPGQRILIFFNGYAEKAVVWVEDGGEPVQVPMLPEHTDMPDFAIDLAGDVVTSTHVGADGKIYMFRFMANGW